MKRLFIIVAILFSTSSYAAQLDLPRDAEGWTIFTPSADSRIVYVSSSGNDSTAQVYNSTSFADPFKPSGEQAFATYAAAFANIRQGYPDWILFKRGDTFYQAMGSNVPRGRSITEPALVAWYGADGDMPLLMTPKGIDAFNMKRTAYYSAVSGLDFYAYTRDPNNPSYAGTDKAGGISFTVWSNADAWGEGILVEGCRLRYYTGGISVANVSTDQSRPFAGVTIRRNTILDSYADTDAGSHKTMGMWSQDMHDLILEENIFDHNGWYDKYGGSIGYANIYNHNTYFQDTHETIFRGNMFLRGSNMGTKFTANGKTHAATGITIKNNLYYGSMIGVGIGGNKGGADYRFKDIIVDGNVFTRLGSLEQTNQSIAWGIEVIDNQDSLITNNLILNDFAASGNSYGIALLNKLKNVTISNNTIYNIDGHGFFLNNHHNPVGTLSFQESSLLNNIIQKTTGYTIKNRVTALPETIAGNIVDNNSETPFAFADSAKNLVNWQTDTGDMSTVIQKYSFVDPTRDIDTYMASIGETASVDTFIQKARQMGRFNWDNRFTAASVNGWIKAGFEINFAPNILTITSPKK